MAVRSVKLQLFISVDILNLWNDGTQPNALGNNLTNATYFLTETCCRAERACFDTCMICLVVTNEGKRSFSRKQHL